jgi:hypothetical protein
MISPMAMRSTIKPMVSTTQLLLFLIPGGIGFLMLLVIVPLCGTLPKINLPLVGQIPLTLCLAIGLMSFMGWGLIFSGGWAIATELFPIGLVMQRIVMLAIAASLYTSITFSKILGRWFRDTSSEITEERFIGLNGRVVSAFLPYYSDGRVGQLNVTDRTDTSGVAAVIPDWAEDVPQTNDSVQIIVFDQERQLFIALKPQSDDQLRWLDGKDPFEVLPR